MGNIKHLYFLFLLISYNSLAQELQSYAENSRTADELCVAFKGNSFSTETDANSALDQIISVVGVSRNFIIRACENIPNAMAISLKGIRYIYYNTEFMNQINSKSRYWTNMSILAHEVGHHINGHTIDVLLYANNSVEEESLSASRSMELQADEFSGFVLAKLGATINQATEAISKMTSDDDDTYSTHPKRSKRLLAIKKGYQRAKSQNNALIKSSIVNEPPKVETITRVVEKTVTDTVKVYDTVKVEISEKIETKEELIENSEIIKEEISVVSEEDNSYESYMRALNIYEKIENFTRISRAEREGFRSEIESLLSNVSESDKESLWLRGINLLNGFFEGHNDSDESWQKRGCLYLKKAKELGFQIAEEDFDFYCF
tara:strand:- start:751 stop:1878 length:1128 start_codon:yes stop_codon:yes gene_type:complete